ncbi:MAG: M48 family metallopeptidase [Candidatus Methanofastidiosia archaeon]
MSLSFLLLLLLTLGFGGIIFFFHRYNERLDQRKKNNILLRMLILEASLYYLLGFFLVFIQKSYILRILGYLLLFLLLSAPALSFFSYRYSASSLLKRFNAESFKNYRFGTLVRRLSRKFRISKPELYFVSSELPNALILGNKNSSKLIVTDGLLSLHEDEVEAVVAHEFAHMLSHDSFLKSLTSSLSKLFFFDPLLKYLNNQLILQREFMADERSVKITKKPLNLASALQKLYRKTMGSDSSGLPENSYSRAPPHLFFKREGFGFGRGIPTNPILKERLLISSHTTHSSIRERVKRLFELEERLR